MRESHALWPRPLPSAAASMPGFFSRTLLGHCPASESRSPAADSRTPRCCWPAGSLLLLGDSGDLPPLQTAWRQLGGTLFCGVGCSLPCSPCQAVHRASPRGRSPWPAATRQSCIVCPWHCPCSGGSVCPQHAPFPHGSGGRGCPGDLPVLIGSEGRVCPRSTPASLDYGGSAAGLAVAAWPSCAICAGRCGAYACHRSPGTSAVPAGI